MEVNVAFLRKFRFERVLNDDPLVHSLCMLGSLPDGNTYAPAIVTLQKTHLSVAGAAGLVQGLVEEEEAKPIEANDIYHWLLGWLARSSESPDVKITVIFPATDVHVRKYSRQRVAMVRETPLLYQTVVQPYITGVPPARLEWVHNILAHRVEAHKILFDDADPETGFVILPDMKWDLATPSTLYLVAIARARSIATLRDLTRAHVPMLRAMRSAAARLARDRWGLDGARALRFYIHYQPSYYHFHVHIVNANYAGFRGICVGQAHMLEDVISLLELSPEGGPTLLAQMTLTYELGEQHGLFRPMLEAQQRAHAEDDETAA